MNRYRFIIFVSLSALACVFIVTAFSAHQEPKWEGRPLSSWLTEGHGDIGSHTGFDTEAADRAVRNIGVKALPYLVHELGTKHSPTKSIFVHFARKQSVISVQHVDGEMRRIQALGAFQALGQMATPALPQIRRYLSDLELQSDAQKAIDAILADEKTNKSEKQSTETTSSDVE